jgi:hypothetical protein
MSDLIPPIVVIVTATCQPLWSHSRRGRDAAIALYASSYVPRIWRTFPGTWPAYLCFGVLLLAESILPRAVALWTFIPMAGCIGLATYWAYRDPPPFMPREVAREMAQRGLTAPPVTKVDRAVFWFVEIAMAAGVVSLVLLIVVYHYPK